MSWILSFGPDAELVEPAELRSEILGRLEEILAS
jgi:predicted DNA-binding transcriptional regulator YafY